MGRVYNSPILLINEAESKKSIVMIYNTIKMDTWQVILQYTDSITE